ncbi:NUDIX domain-containing protein [Paenibacillus zeisoli]|uniref:NUDIX domain-containing protein n=1 Tax=Paenibacillus zeisoli TaxID=2496267 RepID=UPI001FE895A2|nr:NUDIX domain-containing protein [Paenibacillus zeisoli]
MIIDNDSILLVEYDERGVHYNLPGGGLEPGETVVEGVKREVLEETGAEIEVGPLALVYEMAPHKQSGDYNDNPEHGLHLIFECKLTSSSLPQLPPHPDPHQTTIKWIPINELDRVILIPNINEQIIDYVQNRRNIEVIEDHQLERLKLS